MRDNIAGACYGGQEILQPSNQRVTPDSLKLTINEEGDSSS